MFQDILLGVGITLIVISLILIGVNDDLFQEEDKLTEDEIINQARKIGMYFPGENYQNEISLDSKIKLNAAIINDSKSSQPSPITITIPSGISSRKIVSLLLEKNLIKDKENFLKLLTKFDLENKIMAGTYKLQPNISALELLLLLTTE